MINHSIFVDECDRHFLDRYRWRASGKSGHAGAYLGVENGKEIFAYLHRLIMNAQPGDIVDHMNGNVLDNRRQNLRVVTQSVNMQNFTKLGKRNKSGFRGVFWVANRRKWRVQARIGPKHYRIGEFADLTEAARVACSWRKEHMPGYICRCPAEVASA